MYMYVGNSNMMFYTKRIITKSAFSLLSRTSILTLIIRTVRDVYFGFTKDKTSFGSIIIFIQVYIFTILQNIPAESTNIIDIIYNRGLQCRKDNRRFRLHNFCTFYGLTSFISTMRNEV